MAEKQEVPEDAYRAVLQDSRDKVKAGLPEFQSPEVRRHTHGDSVCTPCLPESNDAQLRSATSAGGTMPSEGIQGDEWGTYVTLDTFSATGTRDGLKDASPKVTESP